MTLPIWNGADHVYARLMTIADSLNKSAYAAQHAKAKRPLASFSPSAEADYITEALGIGDEETCKALQYQYRGVKGSY